MMSLLKATTTFFLTLAFIVPNFAFAALPDGLVWYTDMEDTGGGARVTENTGVYTFTKASAGNPTQTTGLIGNAQTFTTDYITTDFDPNTTIGTGDFTAMCWFDVTTSASRRAFMAANDSGAFNNFFNMDAGNNGGDGSAIRTNFRAGTSGEALLVSSSTSFQDGAYHQAIVTRTGTTARLYVDAGLEYSLTNAEIGVDLGAVFQIGRINTANAMTGDLDECGMWNRVLESGEISTLYNSGSGLSYDDIIALGGNANGIDVQTIISF